MLLIFFIGNTSGKKVKEFEGLLPKCGILAPFNPATLFHHCVFGVNNHSKKDFAGRLQIYKHPFFRSITFLFGYWFS